MANPVVHFEIACRNSEVIKEFYSKLFGWKISEGNPSDYREVYTQSGLGIKGGITVPSRTYVTFYIAVDDLNAFLSKAESLGGKTVMPPVRPNSISFAQFSDIEGNIIGLVEKSKQT